MAIEREVAGLRCSEVLAELSDYLDGDLEAARRARIEAHLQGCDACERFGASFTAAVHALRREEGPALGDPVIYERLRTVLRQAMGEGGASEP